MTDDDRRFDDLVDDEGNIDLDQLVATVDDGDVAFGALADEDLAWFSRTPDRRPDAQFDGPRLGRLDDDGFRAAMDSSFAVLAARGELVVDDDGDVGSAGPRGFVVGLQRVATRRMRVEATTADGPRRLVLHRLPEDVVLVRRVGLGGIHHAWFARPETAVAAVAALVDPDARAATTSPAQRATDPGQLDPPLSALEAQAEVTARVDVQALVDGEPDPDDRRALTTFALPDRLVLTVAGGPATEHTAQELSPRDLLSRLRAVLRGDDQGD